METETKVIMMNRRILTFLLLLFLLVSYGFIAALLLGLIVIVESRRKVSIITSSVNKNLITLERISSLEAIVCRRFVSCQGKVG
jgi:hypothetical protein